MPEKQVTGNKNRIISLLREYLTIRNIIIFATPLSLAVLIIMLFNLSMTVEHLSRSIIKSTTEETQRKLNTFFDPAINILKISGQWGTAAMINENDPAKLNPRFIPLLKNNVQISSMLIANTSGNEYMLLKEDSTWVNRIVSYKNGKQEITRFRWQFDERLNIIGDSSWRDNRKYDPRERPWFKGGLSCKPGEMSWTQPYIFFTTKDPGITVSMNWHSNTQLKDTFVIAYDIMLTDLSAYTTKLVTGKHGKAFILTSDSRLIGLPRDERFTNVDSLKKYVLNDYQALGISELSGAVDMWKEDGRPREPFRYKINKKLWWAGFQAFSLGKNNNFFIGVIVPEDDFMAEVNRTRTIIIAGFLLVFILTLLVIRGYNQKQKAYALLEKQNIQILKQKQEIESQRDEITHQRDKIEEQRNEITDSIKYSRRIQTAILPPEEIIGKILPDHFVFYRPKDIVSGDFYWVYGNTDGCYWAAADCTGHGVPGALMSIIGYTGLNSCLKEHHLVRPGEILDRLNSIIAETFSHDSDSQAVRKEGSSTIRDGMDIALCRLDRLKMKLEIAAAYNPVYIVRKNGTVLICDGEPVEPSVTDNQFSLYEIKADRQPVGSYEGSKKFSTRVVDALEGDTVYSFSDGLSDQFGGVSGKKFMSKQLKSLLLSMQELKSEERIKAVEKAFLSWKGEYDQVDDILVMGVVISA